MTYIDRLNGFNQWLESNALPIYSQLMYFKLLNVFNRAGWPKYVQVDNLRMMTWLGGTSKSTVLRARDKLVSAGFIRFKKGGKGDPNRYELVDLRYSCDTINATINDTESATISDTTNDTHIKTKTKNKTKTSPLTPQGESMPPVGQNETGFGPQLQAAFEQWLAYKRERREGYKPTGLQSLMTQIRNAASEHGDVAVIEVIQQSMASGYRGIMFDRLKKGSNPAQSGHAAASYDIDELESMSGFLPPENL